MMREDADTPLTSISIGRKTNHFIHIQTIRTMAKIMDKIKVRNLVSPSSGREVANQFLITIHTAEGVKKVFQSYRSVIAVQDEHGKITLDKYKWDYSATTGKYRNQFLGEGINDTRKKIEAGIYSLADLN